MKKWLSAEDMVVAEVSVVVVVVMVVVVAWLDVFLLEGDTKMRKRFKYNMSNYVSTSGNLGYLLPAGPPKEVVPGDTWDLSTSCLLRLSTLVAPIMHPLHVQVHHWFVPHEMVFDGFETWWTGGSDGNGDGVTFPTISHAADSQSLITGFMGFKRTSATAQVISALPVRGYNLIWDKFYRDEQVDSGWTDPYAEDQLVPQRVRWNKDMITTLRASEELGDEVSLPLAGQYDIRGLYVDQTDTYSGTADMNSVGALNTLTYTANDVSDNPVHVATNHAGVYADLSNGQNESSIKDLEEAIALHHRREWRNKFGYRYDEVLKSMGIRTNRSNVNPEYLGGGKQTVNISEVIQTAEGTNPVGELRGHGLAAMRSNRFRRFFTQHGYIHSLIIVRPINMWQDAQFEGFWKMGRDQFYQPELDGIGMDAVLKRMVYGDSTNSTDIMGYRPRYDEYRSQLNYVCGDLRVGYDTWHLGPQYSSDPALNATFMACNPREDAFADSSEDNFKGMVYHRAVAKRIIKPSR